MMGTATVTELREAHRLSGLTMAQLARMIGVNPRRIQQWLAVGRIPVVHQPSTARTITAINEAHASCGQLTAREALLASATGLSIYHQLAADAARPQQQIQRPALTGTQQFAA